MPALTGTYNPDSTYIITVTVTQTGMTKFGFDFEALLGGDTLNAGTLAIMTDSTNDQIMQYTELNDTNLNDVTHTLAGITGVGTKSFSFLWTAPATGAGAVTFFVAGLANNTISSKLGAYVYTDSLVLIQSTVGIAEKAAKNFNLSVFPNPTSENLNVQFSLKGISSVNMDMLDINGSKVADLISENGMNGVINKTFDVSTLAKGIYFVRLNINGESTIQKIVVE
jgi:hypothetical protein